METLIIVVKLVVPAFIAASALAWLFQDGLIFIPQPRSEQALRAVLARHPTAEEIRLPTEDGETLHGWFLRAAGRPAGTRGPLLIYYGGNAEEVSGHLDEAARYQGYSMLLLNYRGYGGSSGKPGEAALYADALRVFDHAISRSDVDAQQMVIMGRSLGTAMAVHVAARRNVRAVLLVSPYDSMVDVGSHHHPYLPVSLLLRHRFEAITDAPRIKVPLLALVAPGDDIVPVKSSRRLVEAWGGPYRLAEIGGATHNLFGATPGYWQAIAVFLAELRGGSS
jgi:dipeptidyl aminopeptidase/acylaminoacyl peptidase